MSKKYSIYAISVFAIATILAVWIISNTSWYKNYSQSA